MSAAPYFGSMSAKFPSVWRATRLWLLTLWVPTIGFIGLVVYAGGTPTVAWPVVAVSTLASVGFLQAEWRISRAIRQFGAAFGPPDAGYVDDGGRQVAEWHDLELQVWGSTRMFSVWRVAAEVGDEEFPFPPRRATHAVQSVQQSLAEHGGDN